MVAICFQTQQTVTGIVVLGVKIFRLEEPLAT